MKDLAPKRNHSLDVTRIVAVLAVVMIHCSASFVTDYASHTSEFIAGNLADSISRMGVPLFLMISGALFLDERKEVTLKSILSRNVKSIAIITVIWSILYATAYSILSPLVKGNPLNTKEILSSIIRGHGHMWYLYMIMGIYVMTPFLKKFVYKENKDMVLSFILISFVVQFLVPTADEICLRFWEYHSMQSWLDQFHLDFFGGYITYYLTGWYIVHIRIEEKRLKSIVYSAGLGSLLFIFLYSQFTGDYKTVYEYIGAPVFLYSAGLFLLLNDIKFNFEGKLSAIIADVSKLSFGVYIIHVLVLNTFTKILPYSSHCISYLLLSFAVVTCSSFLCIFVMSKIPFLKKLIRM